jgi:hypothetical protein
MAIAAYHGGNLFLEQANLLAHSEIAGLNHTRQCGAFFRADRRP